MQTDNLATELISKGQAESDSDVLERARARRAAREQQTTTEQAPKPKEGDDKNPLERAGAIAVDIGGGIVEIPGAVLHGARDAIQETLDLGAALDQQTADLVGYWPALQITNEAGDLDVKFTNLKGKKSKAPQLPEGPTQDTQTGKIVESVAQFGTGFLGAKKLTAAAGLLKNAGPITSAAINGAITDFAAFDGNDGRLADLVAQVPGLGELVPEFMKTSEDEGELTGRLKNTLEGAGVGLAFDFALTSLRALRAQRNAQKALKEVQDKVVTVKAAEEARAVQVDETVKKINGNPSGNRVTKVVTDGPGDFEQWKPNLARINSSEDIQATIEELIKKNQYGIDDARRGYVSNMSRDAQASTINAWDVIKSRRVGDALSDAETRAVQDLWIASVENVREAAQAYRAAANEGTSFSLQRAMKVSEEITKHVHGARAEAGRSLAAWRTIGTGNSFQRMKEIQDAIAMGGLDAGKLDDMAARISMLGDEQIGDLAKVIDETSRRGIDAFGEAWRFMLLSNPKTHVVNGLGNTSVIMHDIIETAFAGRLGRLLGDDIAGELVEEAAVKTTALRTAVADQFKYFAQNRKFNNMGVVVGKIDAPRPRAVSAAVFDQNPDTMIGKSLDTIGKVLSIPQDALGGADDFFKGVNFHVELSGRAHRIAMDEVRLGTLAREDIGKRMADLVTDPPNDLWEHARLASQTRTFTKPPKRGGIVEKVVGARTWMNSGGLPIGHILLPFINTPANIMKYTFDRTPFGYNLLRHELAQGGKDAALAQAKIALGTSGIFLAADMASNGMVSGGGPASSSERQALERTGWQPYSIKMGDTWVRYDRFDPIGNMLGMGADAHEILANRGFDDGEDQELFAVWGSMIGRVGKALLSESYLTGAADFVNVVQDSDRYGPNYMRRLLSSMTVPAGAAEIRRQLDPQMREISTTLDAIKNRTPGMSDTLAPRRDLWGRPQTYQSHIGMAYDALSPFIARKIDPEPIDTELLRLRYFPAMPDRSITVPYKEAGRNVSVSLRNSPEIYSRYVELAGNEAKVFPGKRGTKDFLNDMVASSAYERLADGAEAIPGSKAYQIRKAMNHSKKIASVMLYQEFRSELNDMAARQVAREDAERARQEEEAGMAALEALSQQ